MSKNLYNEKGRPPYPYKSAKSRDLCVAFCTSQGRGAPLVRWPDGHTFFAFLHRTCPARERSMGAEALRQPLAKTRKSGLSHFFDTLRLSPKGRAFLKKEAGASPLCVTGPTPLFQPFPQRKAGIMGAKPEKAEGWTWKNENGRKEPFPWGTSCAGGVQTPGCDGRCAKGF